ncbi:hypothetical protein RR48_11209 [Papilio machaon]|uniref:Uncharacterized protein n=1 Tax=Papilio machaon TaxID=76193 RepID=A0A194QQ64_PAPMA|nr:hypothetical protein RR48_11209 [Papilio machaon]
MIDDGPPSHGVAHALGVTPAPASVPSVDPAEGFARLRVDSDCEYLSRFVSDPLDWVSPVYADWSLDSSVLLQSQWLSEDVSCSLLPPSTGLNTLRQLLEEIDSKCTLEALVRQNNGVRVKNVSIDIKSITEEEAQRVDKMKKQMAHNQLTLQQSIKTLDIGLDNLKFWSDNYLKKYISINRTVDGKTYKEYENAYLETLSLSV